MLIKSSLLIRLTGLLTSASVICWFLYQPYFVLCNVSFENHKLNEDESFVDKFQSESSAVEEFQEPISFNEAAESILRPRVPPAVMPKRVKPHERKSVEAEGSHETVKEKAKRLSDEMARLRASRSSRELSDEHLHTDDENPDPLLQDKESDSENEEKETSNGKVGKSFRKVSTTKEKETGKPKGTKEKKGIGLSRFFKTPGRSKEASATKDKEKEKSKFTRFFDRLKRPFKGTKEGMKQTADHEISEPTADDEHPSKYDPNNPPRPPPRYDKLHRAEEEGTGETDSMGVEHVTKYDPNNPPRPPPRPDKPHRAEEEEATGETDANKEDSVPKLEHLTKTRVKGPANRRRPGPAKPALEQLSSDSDSDSDKQ